MIGVNNFPVSEILHTARARAILTLALLLGPAIVGCRSSSTGVPLVYTAFVFGSITTAQGASVAGARIQSEVFIPNCDGGTRVGEGSPTVAVTDAAGRFRHRVISERPVTTQCVRVSVMAAGSNAVLATGMAPAVQFKVQSDASIPYDSARVDISLP